MEKQLKPGSVIRFQRKNGELVIGEVQTVEKENCKVIWNQAGLFGKIRNFKRTVQWKEINQVLQYKSKDGFCHIKKLLIVGFFSVIIISIGFHYIFRKVILLFTIYKD